MYHMVHHVGRDRQEPPVTTVEPIPAYARPNTIPERTKRPLAPVTRLPASPRISDAPNANGIHAALSRALHEPAVTTMSPQTIASEPIGYRSTRDTLLLARTIANPT